MSEKDFGEKVAHLLHSNLANIDDATSAKLKGARLAALARYAQVTDTSGVTLTRSNQLTARFGSFFNQRPLLWGPVMAALLALGITGYLQLSQSEPDDLDAFLLAGDLPVHAYIDKDFDTWLKGYSR